MPFLSIESSHGALADAYRYQYNELLSTSGPHKLGWPVQQHVPTAYSLQRDIILHLLVRSCHCDRAVRTPRSDDDVRVRPVRFISDNYDSPQLGRGE